VLALTIAGCSSGDQKPPAAGGEAEVGTTSDINPQDPATLRQGGNLRLALDALPANYNSLHIDSEATGAAMMRATLPRAFRIAPDGSTTVNTDYFHQRRTHRHRPAGRHLHDQPQGGVERRRSITWEDIASQINATNARTRRSHSRAPTAANASNRSRAGSTTDRR